MASKPMAYRRVSRRRWFSFGLVQPENHELWLGEDHVLSLRLRRFSERHLRFYFKDIQAVTVQATGGRQLVSFGLVACAVVIGTVALYLGYGVGGFGGQIAGAVSGVTCLLLMLALAGNVALGPMCVCRLHTAVQVEELKALRRLRGAQRFAREIRPLCEAVQGAVEGQTMGDVAAVLPSPAVSTHAFTETAAKRHEEGRFHAALFAFFVLDGLFSIVAWDFFQSGVLGTGVALAVFLGGVGINVTALIKQRGSDIPASLRLLTWSCAVFTFLTVMAVTFIASFELMLSDFTGEEFSEEEFSELVLSQDLEAPMWFVVPSSVLEIVLGLIGLALLYRFRLAYLRRRMATEEP